LSEQSPRSALTGPAAEGCSAQVFVDDLGRVELEPEDVHHLSRVLRLRSGERVVASDGAGSWRSCAFRATTSASGSVLEPVGEIEIEETPRPRLYVGFVPVKAQRPEWIVQKLTEVGVDCIAVLRSTRSVVQIEGKRWQNTLERLERVAREAAAQSRRAWLPEITGVLSLTEFDAHAAPSEVFLAQPGAPDASSVSVNALAVGPEGGWDLHELEGRRLLGLSSTILRAETAAVVAGYVLARSRDAVRGHL
jgi:16S rRNA (uracil1498-N3)-methyltransferase